jgi:hypothetical protein
MLFLLDKYTSTGRKTPIFHHSFPSRLIFLPEYYPFMSAVSTYKTATFSKNDPFWTTPDSELFLKVLILRHITGLRGRGISLLQGPYIHISSGIQTLDSSDLPVRDCTRHCDRLHTSSVQTVSPILCSLLIPRGDKRFARQAKL